MRAIVAGLPRSDRDVIARRWPAGAARGGQRHEGQARLPCPAVRHVQRPTSCEDGAVRAGIVGMVALLCACATTTSAIGPGHTPDPEYAYLYGRFFIRADEQEGSFVGHPQIVLRVWCRNSQEYSIAFSTKRDVQVLKVHPHAVRSSAELSRDQNGIVRHRMNVERAEMVFNDFQAGRAYYLGDYFARGILEVSMRPSYTVTFLSWAMDSADGHYESTTAEMKATFRNLAALPTADERLIPAKPAPKRGAVVIADPEEPPMTPSESPRRAVHQVHLRSPAACERACPKGQCLRFAVRKAPP